MTPTRKRIITDFAKWTVLSAARRAPIRSRKKVYSLIEFVSEERIIYFNRKIKKDRFDKWHQATTKKIKTSAHNKKFSVGWAAKFLNVYLKTFVYIGGEGRKNLKNCIHPPIDHYLWKGIKHFAEENNIKINKSLFKGISAIKDYEKDYMKIINECKKVKTKRQSLFEVEELWEGTKI